MIKILWAVFLSFGKIGLIALGGGNSMLQLLEYETVTLRHWVTQEQFISMLGTSFLFPGLTGIKLAALIGNKVAGLPGLLLAVISLNGPGLVMALVGYRWLTTHPGPVINKIMVAVQYGALALLAAATYSVAQGVVKIYFAYPIALATVLFFAMLVFLNVSPFWGFMGFIAVCFFMV